MKLQNGVRGQGVGRPVDLLHALLVTGKATEPNHFLLLRDGGSTLFRVIWI